MLRGAISTLRAALAGPSTASSSRAVHLGALKPAKGSAKPVSCLFIPVS